MFKFDLGINVRIIVSGTHAVVIARSEYLNGTPAQYLLRYKTVDGDGIEAWWGEDAIEDAP